VTAGTGEALPYYGLRRPPGTAPVSRDHQRRVEVDAAVKAMFADARGAHGSPRLHADLRDAGWIVTKKTVADSMRRQGLVARKVKRRRV
jgi:hypothetical protein